MVDLNLVKPENLWYVVGYIASDGNLSIDGRHVFITSKDINHLEKIGKVLLIKNKIFMKGRDHEIEKKYGVLAISDVHFYYFLLQIGLGPRKSLVLTELKVPNKFFTDFLRGVIDGDGNIRTWIHPQNNAEQWELRIFSAAPVFAKWLKDKTEKYFNVKGVMIETKPKPPRHSMYIIKFGKMAACVILRLCYYKHATSLNRKHVVAQQCVYSYLGWKRSLTVRQ